MKKINLILAILLTSLITYGQGWVGNSTNNSLVPYNTALGLSPINIGIGVNPPSEQLHTNGGVRFEGLQRNDTPNRIVVQNATGKLFWRDASTIGSGQAWNLLGNLGTIPANHFVGTRDNQRLVFRTNNLERMTILENGNVAIGINSSNTKLHIHNNLNADNHLHISGIAPSIWLYGGNTLPTASPFPNPFMRIGLATQNNNFINGSIPKDLIIQNMSDSNSIIFSSKWNGIGLEQMRLNSDGNLGIGTNTPQNMLHVAGGANIETMPMKQVGDNLVFQDGSGSGELRTLSPGAPNTFLSGDGTWQTVGAGATTNTLIFSNPNTLTSIVNGVSSTTTIPVSTSNTINNCGTIGGVPRLTAPNTYSCGTLFDNGAAVGIGSTGPFNYTTSVWRSTGAATTGTLRLRVAGNVQGTHFVATSDKTLKTDIKSIENASSLINRIEGKTYAWKEEYQKEFGVDNGRHYGFLAQDIEKVIPEAVIIDEKGRYAVEYNAVIPVLVESQKELIAENNALKLKLASFEEKFALLEKSIMTVCETGCEGLKNMKTDVNILYQSIPNPTDDVALINYALVSEKSQAEIMLMTQDGKMIENFKLEAKAGSGSIKVSLGHLTSGTYLYTLVIDGKVFDTKKMQVIK